MTPELFDTYTQLVIDHGQIRGRETITQLIAIGAAESGLDNLAIGNNAKNGTDPTHPAYYYCGWGWLQFDEYWMAQNKTLNGVDYNVIELRKDPLYSLNLIMRTPGYVLFQGVDSTYIKWTLWSAYPRKTDGFMGSARDSYDRVTGL